MKLILLCWSFLTAALAAELPWSDVADVKKYPSVVAIENFTFSFRGSGCTGVFISQNYVLTAGHCSAAYSRFLIGATQMSLMQQGSPFKLEDCNPDKLPNANLWNGFLIPVERSEKLDYQILKVQWIEGRNRPAVVPAQIKPSIGSALVGADVEVLGYPVDRKGLLTLSSGKLLAVDYDWQIGDRRDSKLLVYSAITGPQMSGGPVFQKGSGELIGVVHGSVRGELDDADVLKLPDLERQAYGTNLARIVSESPILREILGGKENLSHPPLFDGAEIMQEFSGAEGRDMLSMSCPRSR